MDRLCDYPGCRQVATIRCGAIGCLHHVCEVHGNCGYEETPDHPPVEICWGCGGKGWGWIDRRDLPGIHRFATEL